VRAPEEVGLNFGGLAFGGAAWRNVNGSMS
jgi:hypothetical protein